MNLSGLLRPGIRLQFVAVMIAASLVFGTSVLAFLQVLVVDALERTTQENYSQLIEVLAPTVSDHVLTDRAFELQLLLHLTAERDPLLDYLLVTSPQGEVIASNYGSQLPADLGAVIAAAERNIDDDTSRILVRDGERDLLHLRTPLLDGVIGSLHAGIDQEPMRSSARGITFNIAVLFAVLTVVGIGLAFVVGHVLTEPLRTMTVMARQIGHGDLTGRIPVQTADEVGDLAAAFNDMTSQLEESRQALVRTEKLAAAGRLAAGVAHEINNPLASLRACLWALRKPNLREQDRRRHQDSLDGGLKRIAQIVQRLLEFARPTALRRAPTQLSRVAQSAVDLVRPAVSENGIRIDTELREGLPDLAVDPAQIEQVLVNLLLNAVHAMQDAGIGETISVRLREIPSGQRLEVEDDGPGIPESEIDHVFEPFFSTRPEGKGTGLGLSVSQSIAEGHGGSLHLWPSTHGRGVLARLDLPQHDPSS